MVKNSMKFENKNKNKILIEKMFLYFILKCNRERSGQRDLIVIENLNNTYSREINWNHRRGQVRKMKRVEGSH